MCFASSGTAFRRFWSSTWPNDRARLSPVPYALPTSPCTVIRPAGSAFRRIGTSTRSINLVAIFVLKGRGRFVVCQDHTGRGAVDLPNAPGDLLLLRAPEFHSTKDRPFHAVLDIVEERLTFALR